MDRLESDYNPNQNSNPIAIETPDRKSVSGYLFKLMKFHARTKHIDIDFKRECVEKGRLMLEYCATEDILADALTKGLARDRHWKLLGEMDCRNCNIIKEK
jgi:hypothetical protein